MFLAVNLMLVCIPKSKTAEKQNLRESIQYGKKAVLDSGNYRHGFTITEKKIIDAGTYVLIASTFHAGQLGKCTITIDSSVGVLAKPIA